MFNTEQLQEKWAPVLKHDGLPEIKDNYRKCCQPHNSWKTKSVSCVKSVR